MQELSTQKCDWILGIDVAKAKFDIALLLPTGKFKSKVFDNEASGFRKLDAWLGKQGVASLHACMEATGVYWEALAEHLVDAGHQVSVINPARIKAFGTSQGVRTKTDKVDARLIATFCQRISPEPWQAPSVALRALRALVLRRQALDTGKCQASCRLDLMRLSLLRSRPTTLLSDDRSAGSPPAPASSFVFCLTNVAGVSPVPDGRRRDGAPGVRRRDQDGVAQG